MNNIIIISGFSGSGKGTIAKELLKINNNYVLSISATTRNKRVGEIDGESYFFVSNEKFEDMIKNDELLEYAKYISCYYGTPKDYVLNQLEKGNNVILEIDVVGALQIKKKYDDAILIFIMPPSAKILYERLLKRGTENKEQIAKRFEKSLEETKYINKYDIVVVNDDSKQCASKIDYLVNNKDYIKKEKNNKFINQIIYQYIEDVKGGKYV